MTTNERLKDVGGLKDKSTIDNCKKKSGLKAFHGDRFEESFKVMFGHRKTADVLRVEARRNKNGKKEKI